tara:strand:+ start:1239 stop:4757 length:3519 start_codon:yes stop_codon:yes gene_type:complete
MKKKYIILVILFFFPIKSVKAITFNNFYDLDQCVDNYSSFTQYKTNLKKCFKNHDIILEENSLVRIKNRTGIIDHIIKLDLPKKKPPTRKPKKKLSEVLQDIFSEEKLEKKAIEEDLFKKPTIFSDDYNKEKKFISENKNFKKKQFSLNNKDFSKLNSFIKNNPRYIYAVTEDINILTYQKKYLSEFKRKEILLNVYNSFDPNLFISQTVRKITPGPNAITTVTPVGAVAAGGLMMAALAGGGGGSSSSPSTPATLSFSFSTTNVAECNETVTITGTLTKTHSSNVTITYSTSGTATDGADYNLSATTSTITAGSTSAAITLTPVNDTTVETSETAIIAASVSGVSTTGNTSATINILDYVLKCNSTAYSEDTSVQSTITGRSSWTTVDQSTNNVHPYELFNLHKAHSFKDGNGTYLLGEGQTVYVVDSSVNVDHDSFSGKTFTVLNCAPNKTCAGGNAPSSTSADHGTHVSSIIAGVVGGTTHGVAPEADLAWSNFGDNGTNMSAHIDTARITHSAIAMNNSWHYLHNSDTSAVEWSELVTTAAANGRNIREQLNASGYHIFGSHTSTTITALDNFQETGVCVWCNSNFVNDTDTSFLAGLPNYFNGTDDSVDLSEAWISVMYAEFTGTSLSGASTSDFNRLGNPCGNSKEWCLVVDDAQIGAAGYVNGSGTSIYSTMGGCSMGTPMVSGMIALLAQAFPNHTPEQLTDRLLASANNEWFTPSGNTTFTTHGASIKHGYHDTWGHGVPDMYAALSPITTNGNPASGFGFATTNNTSVTSSPPSRSSPGSASSGGSVPFSQIEKLAVSETAMKISSSLGDGIMNGLKDKTAYAYDALNGGFKYNVSDFINYDSLTEQKIEYTLDQELDFLRNFKFSENKIARDFNVYAGEFFNFRDKYNKGLSFTLDQPNLALQNFNLYNNQHYKNLFTSENKGVGFNNIFNFLGNNVLLGYNNSKFNPITNINKDITVPMETLALSINLDSDNFELLSFTTGLLKEENTFLLSEGSGAFGLNNKDNLSYFYGFNFSKSLNNLGNIYFSTMLGNSKLNNAQNSFIVDTSDVLSSNFEINYELKNILKNDQLNISLSQPNKVEHGDMTFRLMGLVDKNGILPYNDYEIDLKPSGRQKDLTISYYKNHSNNFKTGFKTIITDDMGHVKNSNLESNFMLTTSLTF